MAEGHRERLRARFLANPTSLPEVELLELLLTFAILRRDVRPLAEKLLRHFGSLNGVLNADHIELASFTGAASSAVLISVVNHLRILGKQSEGGTVRVARHVESSNADAKPLDIVEAGKHTDNRIPKKVRNTHRALPELELFQVNESRRDVSLIGGKTRFPEPMLRVYAKDLSEHALKYIPKLAGCRTIDETRRYLTDTLPFNSQATRRRSANYLINRFFPGNNVNADLPMFAVAVEGRPALGDALFYLTCRTEKIVALVAEDVVFASLAQGGVSRPRIRDFVQTLFPNSKSATQVGSAIVAAYQTFGVATATRTKLNVSLREGSLATFAYVLYLEFPEPGMHRFEQMLDGRMHKWLLWDKDWMIRQLYRLREAGLLPKVSEIDRLRHFTTKYTLVEAMEPIVALARETPQ